MLVRDAAWPPRHPYARRGRSPRPSGSGGGRGGAWLAAPAVLGRARGHGLARRAFDGCLITVRALLELRQRDAARERARECQRLFPDVVPDPREHPPYVIGWLAEVRAELDVEAHGVLRVDSRPSGCAVYLQGRSVGVTPFERANLTPGEQRVQVECGQGRPGRVHRVVLGEETAVVEIDTRLDSVIRTRGGIELRYPDASEEDGRRLTDCLAVARVVDALDVLLLTPAPARSVAGRVRIDRVRVGDGEVVGSAWITSWASDGDLRSALAALARGESIDTTRTLAGPAAAWQPRREIVARRSPSREPPPAAASARSDRPVVRGDLRLALGLTSGAFGLISLAFGFAPSRTTRPT